LQATGANSNAKMAAREVPIDGSRRARQWVGVTRAGGAYMDESSSVVGRGVTPLQGAFFRNFAVFLVFSCALGGDIYFRGSGIHWNGWPFKLTK